MKKPTKRQIRAALEEARFQLCLRWVVMSDELSTSTNERRKAVLAHDLGVKAMHVKVLNWIINNHELP